MSEKRDFLFKFVPPNVRSKLILDEEALYSTTDQLTADKIAKDVLKYVSSDSVITDATACIGGSAFAFSQYFNKVNAIEIDPIRFKYLVSNINLLEVKNIECIYGDAIEECLKIKHDVIFIDPPWGGPEYKKHKLIHLYLSNIPLSDVCKSFKVVCDFIVIKVPKNFDEETFIKDTDEFMNIIYKNTNLRKMNLLILKINNN